MGKREDPGGYPELGTPGAPADVSNTLVPWSPSLPPIKKLRKVGYRINKRHVQAITMIANGNKVDAVARFLKVTPSTVNDWLRNSELIELYKEILLREGLTRYAKAFKVLDKQLDDSNPWVSQGAAREMIARIGEQLLGLGSKEITIRIEGAPMLGMPTGAQFDEEE